MPNEANNTVKNIWQSQPGESMKISLAELQRKAKKLESRVQWRNVREYAASAIVIVAFGYYIFKFHDPLIRLGCVLVVAGTLFMVYTLHQRGAAQTVPAEMGLRPSLEFHRRELERQRDLLRSVWTWYLLPFVPGLSVFLVGLFRTTMQQPNAAAHAGTIVAAYGLAAAGCAAVFVGIGKLNEWGARKLQREIDALNALEEKS